MKKLHDAVKTGNSNAFGGEMTEQYLIRAVKEKKQDEFFTAIFE